MPALEVPFEIGTRVIVVASYTTKGHIGYVGGYRYPRANMRWPLHVIVQFYDENKDIEWYEIEFSPKDLEVHEWK